MGIHIRSFVVMPYRVDGVVSAVMASGNTKLRSYAVRRVLSFENDDISELFAVPSASAFFPQVTKFTC